MFLFSSCPVQDDPVPGPFCRKFKLGNCLRAAFKDKCTCTGRALCLKKLTATCKVSHKAAGGSLASFKTKAAQFFDNKCA
jgi:hypothetical protein